MPKQLKYTARPLGLLCSVRSDVVQVFCTTETWESGSVRGLVRRTASMARIGKRHCLPCFQQPGYYVLLVNILFWLRDWAQMASNRGSFHDTCGLLLWSCDVWTRGRHPHARRQMIQRAFRGNWKWNENKKDKNQGLGESETLRLYTQQEKERARHTADSTLHTLPTIKYSLIHAVPCRRHQHQQSI